MTQESFEWNKARSCTHQIYMNVDDEIYRNLCKSLSHTLDQEATYPVRSLVDNTINSDPTQWENWHKERHKELT